MKSITFILIAVLVLAIVALVPLALLWVVTQWQLILSGELSILTWEAWITSLCTLCIVDLMLRLRRP